jgi:hypothetical protein
MIAFHPDVRAWLHRAVVLAASLSVAAAWVAGPARACSCAQPPDVPTAFEGATAVFLGTVTSVGVDTSGAMASYGAVFSVTESWKGPAGSEIRVVTAQSSAACGFDFQVGVAYVIYAYVWPGDEDVTLRTHLCTRTHAAFDGDPDIPLLGTPSLPTTWGALKASYHR